MLSDAMASVAGANDQTPLSAALPILRQAHTQPPAIPSKVRQLLIQEGDRDKKFLSFSSVSAVHLFGFGLACESTPIDLSREQPWLPPSF